MEKNFAFAMNPQFAVGVPTPTGQLANAANFDEDDVSESSTASERKRRHKLTEQKGRQKINNQINELKELLPECKYVITTKSSVLECTINSLRKLQSVCNQLVTTNKKLQNENAFLRQELERVAMSRVTATASLEADPFAVNHFPTGTATYAPAAPEDDGFGFFEGIPQVNPLELGLQSTEAPKIMDPNYHSPNSSPQSTSSDSSNTPPNHYLPQHLVSREEDEEDPLSAVVRAQGYKISRQKLFLIFLFLVPFFFSLEHLNLPVMGTTVVTSTARNLMSLSGVISPPALTLGFLLEVLRLLFYVFWGIMGFTWIANTIRWFFLLESKDESYVPAPNGQFFTTYSRVSL